MISVPERAARCRGSPRRGETVLLRVAPLLCLCAHLIRCGGDVERGDGLACERGHCRLAKRVGRCRDRWSRRGKCGAACLSMIAEAQS
jgi:hypothetical protein